MDKNFDGGGDTDYNDYTYMEPLKITKIVKVGTSLGVVLPINYLEATGLKRGDQVYVTVDLDDQIRLTKVYLPVIS